MLDLIEIELSFYTYQQTTFSNHALMQHLFIFIIVARKTAQIDPLREMHHSKLNTELFDQVRASIPLIVATATL